MLVEVRLTCCVLALVACGGSGAPASPGRAVDPSGNACSGPVRIPISPLRMLPAEGKKDVYELKADGTIYLNAKLVGQFVCNELRDESGHRVEIVNADDTLVGRLLTANGRFEGDDLVAQPDWSGGRAIRIR